MLVDLDKIDMIYLIKGTPGPSFEQMEYYKDMGYYDDNRGWYWTVDLSLLNETTLLNIYFTLKHYWKK